jgi:hypothetical protein
VECPDRHRGLFVEMRRRFSTKPVAEWLLAKHMRTELVAEALNVPVRATAWTTKITVSLGVGSRCLLEQRGPMNSS